MNWKTVIIVVVAVSVLTPIASAALTIRDNPGYVPSSGLTLGVWTTEYSGRYGWVIDDPFQINLEYQAGILNSDIDAFNGYDPNGSWDFNFSDNDEYVFTVVPAGGLSALTYDGSPSAAVFQWTLTGWGQSIFAGSIVNEGPNSWFFKVDPTQGYRAFDPDALVNNVEVFNGIVTSEVVGYTFQGDLADLAPNASGDGVELGVRVVPEPTTLLIWSLLGLIGLAWARRR